MTSHYKPVSSQEACRQMVMQLAGERFRDFVVLYRSWAAVVGDILSSRSYPIKYDKGFLYIAVSNNVWLQELVLLKKKIMLELNKRTGISINEVYFVIRTDK
ncbi:MAG: DUF721 domain-containing protein [Candidatus Cloacimonadota bacterium]